MSSHTDQHTHLISTKAGTFCMECGHVVDQKPTVKPTPPAPPAAAQPQSDAKSSAAEADNPVEQELERAMDQPEKPAIKISVHREKRTETAPAPAEPKQPAKDADSPDDKKIRTHTKVIGHKAAPITKASQKA